MKSRLVILLQFILVGCSLLATDATDYCDNLLHQCNQFKDKCSPTMITVKSCCDLTSLPLSKAPSGVYAMSTKCNCQLPFTANLAYCDMETSDGGWMVIQRNIKDNVEFFNKGWSDYEQGFGDLSGDKLWYGLKPLSCLTDNGQWELRVDIQFDNNTWSHLHYKQFKVGNTSAEYPLTIGGFTGVTPTDPFVTHPLNGARFSTYDNDNDKSGGNCAASHKNGWWFNNCNYINPSQQPPYVYLNSKGYNLLKVEMKIRQVDCITQ